MNLLFCRLHRRFAFDQLPLADGSRFVPQTVCITGFLRLRQRFLRAFHFHLLQTDLIHGVDNAVGCLFLGDYHISLRPVAEKIQVLFRLKKGDGIIQSVAIIFIKFIDSFFRLPKTQPGSFTGRALPQTILNGFVAGDLRCFSQDGKSVAFPEGRWLFRGDDFFTGILTGAAGSFLLRVTLR